MNISTKKALKIMFFLYMVIILSVLSIRTFAQADSVKLVDDSLLVKRVRDIKSIRYFGYEISGGANRYLLKSNDARFNNLRASFSGFNLGLIYGNFYGTLKANAGLYYSDNTVPYTINVVRAGVSGNIYVLRLLKPTMNNIEPYLVAGVAKVRANIYANTLTADNNSVSEAPYVGHVNWLQASTGAGVEYQLENDKHKFVHLFAEARYGFLLTQSSSTPALDKTQAHYPVLITVGVSFGNTR